MLCICGTLLRIKSFRKHITSFILIGIQTFIQISVFIYTMSEGVKCHNMACCYGGSGGTLNMRKQNDADNFCFQKNRKENCLKVIQLWIVTGILEDCCAILNKLSTSHSHTERGKEGADAYTHKLDCRWSIVFRTVFWKLKCANLKSFLSTFDCFCKMYILYTHIYWTLEYTKAMADLWKWVSFIFIL